MSPRDVTIAHAPSAVISVPLDRTASAILTNLHNEPVLFRIDPLAFYLARSAKLMAHVDLIFLEWNVETGGALRRETPPLKSTVNLLSGRAETVLREQETTWFHNAKYLAYDLLRVTTTIDPVTNIHQVKVIGVKFF